MKIIITPNAFKNSLDPIQAAEAIRSGLEKSRLQADLVSFPIADGGDHTLAVILNHIEGEKRTSRVNDPLNRPIDASYGLSRDGHTAVVEFALAAGMDLLRTAERDPLKASSYGVGQLINEAVGNGAREIWLGVGGSATVDGGAGLLQALGVGLLDKSGNEISRGGGGLNELRAIDLDKAKKRLNDLKFTILCDVENPLLGDQGAAKVFGPQKGADEKMVELLDEGLNNLKEAVQKATGKDISSIKYGGAAGGVPAALWGLLDAELTSGIDFILRLGIFENALQDAQALITGEGKLDRQTLGGKGPAGVARVAKEQGLFVVGLAGAVEEALQSDQFFDAIFTIGSKPQSMEEALQYTARDLSRTAGEVGNLIEAVVTRVGRPNQ